MPNWWTLHPWGKGSRLHWGKGILISYTPAKTLDSHWLTVRWPRSVSLSETLVEEHKFAIHKEFSPSHNLPIPSPCLVSSPPASPISLTALTNRDFQFTCCWSALCDRCRLLYCRQHHQRSPTAIRRRRKVQAVNLLPKIPYSNGLTKLQTSYANNRNASFRVTYKGVVGKFLKIISLKIF